MKIMLPDPVKRDVIKSTEICQIRIGLELIQATPMPYVMKRIMLRRLELKMVTILLDSLFASQNTLNN